MLYMCIYSI